MDVADRGVVLSIGSGRSVDALSRRLFRYLETHFMQLMCRDSRLNFFRKFNIHLFWSSAVKLTLPDFQNT
jgi:hypothetical protein